MGKNDFKPEKGIKSGVYRIKNMRTGDFYIGSSKSLHSRKTDHFKNLKKGAHHCSKLQEAYDFEVDKSVFQYQIFIYCKPEDRIKFEQGCIDSMNPEYNTARHAGSGKGLNHSEETKKKLREIRASQFQAPGEWEQICKKISNTLTGVPKTESHKKAAADSRRGRNLSPEHRKKLSESHIGKTPWSKGKTFTEEHRSNLSLSKKGKPNTSKHILSDKIVFEILNSIEPTSVIAKKIGVSDCTIARIRMNKTYKHIPREKVWTPKELRLLGGTGEKRKRHGDIVRGESHRDSKLTEEKVIYILSSDKRSIDLAEELGVSDSTICNIRKGKTWAHIPRP